MIVSLLGRNGFIGKALLKKLELEGHMVFNYLRPDVEVVYWFAAPSSQLLFNYAPQYCMNETIMGFQNVLSFCIEHKIKLVYPSSATVYNLNNLYAQTKKKLEVIQNSAEYQNILGLRIFAGYGNEEHKSEYASIVYQFAKDIKGGRQPIIYGDGSQTRDFVYIDDVVDSIIKLTPETGIRDIGTGIDTSFNKVINLINETLGTDVEPIYTTKPSKYILDTPCNNPIEKPISIREGIFRICQTI